MSESKLRPDMKMIGSLNLDDFDLPLKVNILILGKPGAEDRRVLVNIQSGQKGDAMATAVYLKPATAKDLARKLIDAAREADSSIVLADAVPGLV